MPAELKAVPPLHYQCRTILMPIFAWERTKFNEDGEVPVPGQGEFQQFEGFGQPDLLAMAPQPLPPAPVPTKLKPAPRPKRQPRPKPVPKAEELTLENLDKEQARLRAEVPKFQSAAAAQSWLQERYPQLKDVDFNSFDSLSRQKVTEQFHTMAQLFPEEAKRILRLGPTTKGEPVYAQATYLTHDPQSGFWSRGIEFNPTHVGDTPQFERSLRRDIVMGFHPVGSDSVESVLTHEFGHVIDESLKAKQHLWKEYAAASNANRNISNYAKKNKNERITEPLETIMHAGFGRQTEGTRMLWNLLKSAGLLRGGL